MNPEELHNIYRAEEEFWWYQGMRAITGAFLERAQPPSFTRGLDAGCGTGRNALEFTSRYGVRMTGVDVALGGVRYCRQRGLERSAVASAMELPFAAESLDLVTTLDVLSHLPPGEDQRALREFYRVLRPGGWVVARVPAFRALRSRHSQYIAEQHRYRAGEMLRKLAAARFEILRWSYANTFLSPVALLKSRVWEAIRREEPHSGVADVLPGWLNRSLLAALQLEAALLRRGVRFWFGQSLLVAARKAD